MTDWKLNVILTIKYISSCSPRSTHAFDIQKIKNVPNNIEFDQNSRKCKYIQRDLIIKMSLNLNQNSYK